MDYLRQQDRRIRAREIRRRIREFLIFALRQGDEVGESQKQGQFGRKQRGLLQRIPVITVMIYGLKSRLAKQNNREKTGSNFKPTNTILSENRFSFSRRLGPTRSRARFTSRFRIELERELSPCFLPVFLRCERAV
jgi:hypothetical protein